MKKHAHAIAFVGSIAFGLIFYNVVIPGECVMLSSRISGLGENVTQEDWLAGFKHITMLWNFWVAMVGVCIWYAFGQLFFRVNDWKSANRWVSWLIILVLVAAISLLPVEWLTPKVENGLWWVRLCYFFNSVFFFYLVTLLFSPPSFKYTPLGARLVRYW